MSLFKPIISRFSPSVPFTFFSTNRLNVLQASSSEFLSEFSKYFVAGGLTFFPIWSGHKIIMNLGVVYFFHNPEINDHPENRLWRASSSSSSNCLREGEWINAWGMVFLTQLCAWLYCRFMNINWGLTLLLPEMHAERWHLARIICTAIKTQIGVLNHILYLWLMLSAMTKNRIWQSEDKKKHILNTSAAIKAYQYKTLVILLFFYEHNWSCEWSTVCTSRETFRWISRLQTVLDMCTPRG